MLEISQMSLSNFLSKTYQKPQMSLLYQIEQKARSLSRAEAYPDVNANQLKLYVSMTVDLIISSSCLLGKMQSTKINFRL